MQTFYRESKEFLRNPINFPKSSQKGSGPVELRLLDYILKTSEKGNPVDVINKIDEFCLENWMMNLGPEKGRVVRHKAFHKDVKKVLEIGGYCGYSALVFANEIKAHEGSKVYTIEINKDYADVARRIHEHAGLANKIHIHIGTVETSLNFIKEKGPFDLIFIDHLKTLYLSDFKLIQANGGVQKGTVVVGDNIIYPGAPEYLAYFKGNPDYDSTLYHSYLEYSNDPDAVLVSVKK